MVSATQDLRSPSQLQDIATQLLVPYYTACDWGARVWTTSPSSKSHESQANAL